jgi:23S rRNA pseudouridine1911/1915/1917 synthase
LSRSRIQSLIKQGDVSVNHQPSKPSYQVKTGDRIHVSIPAPLPYDLKGEAVDINIVHEDDDVIVINKPPGLVVHPAPGHGSGTLVHGLLHHCDNLAGIGSRLRPGIVHRLDKDTSGLIVAAKNDRAHVNLSRQFKMGQVKKMYLALVHGRLAHESGRIELPIARHPKKRKEMSVVPGGRQALTLWEVVETFGKEFSLLSIVLKTGRTHQIRVHLSHINHPVVGDPVYGFGKKWLKKQSTYKQGLLPDIERQMLHARTLGFIHPAGGKYVEFNAPLPDDMESIVRVLRMQN